MDWGRRKGSCEQRELRSNEGRYIRKTGAVQARDGNSSLISETVREVRKVPRLSAVFSRQQHSYMDCIWTLKKWEIGHGEDFGFSDIR